MLADFLDKCGHILILDNSLRASFFAHSSWPRHGWGKEESPPGPPARPPAYPSHCHIRCASVVRRSGVAAEERAQGVIDCRRPLSLSLFCAAQPNEAPLFRLETKRPSPARVRRLPVRVRMAPSPRTKECLQAHSNGMAI